MFGRPPRSGYAPHLAVISHSVGSKTVLVEPTTAKALRDAARKALPKETGGLLSGRLLRDSEGQYVLVSGFVQAGPSAGRSAAFEMSPQATRTCGKSRIAPIPPRTWWGGGTHTGPSSYSTDGPEHPDYFHPARKRRPAGVREG